MGRCDVCGNNDYSLFHKHTMDMPYLSTMTIYSEMTSINELNFICTSCISRALDMSSTKDAIHELIYRYTIYEELKETNIFEIYTDFVWLHENEQYQEKLKIGTMKEYKVTKDNMFNVYSSVLKKASKNLHKAQRELNNAIDKSRDELSIKRLEAEIEISRAKKRGKYTIKGIAIILARNTPRVSRYIKDNNLSLDCHHVREWLFKHIEEVRKAVAYT